jgi:hypothetical protein
MKRLIRSIFNSLLDFSIYLYHRFSQRLREIERVWYDEIPSKGYYLIRLETRESPFNMLLNIPGQIEEGIAKNKHYEPHIMSSIYTLRN